MSLARVVDVARGSAAARAGIRAGDDIISLNGVRPRDVLEYHQLSGASDVEIALDRHGTQVAVQIRRRSEEPLGIELESALFDEVRTCDNHCEFCFIYQLPKGLRKSLYVKDDDYRLSFLYGNFTTLTRFTEADLERVVSEGLSPINVSIHATDPIVRSRMLRNRRGATSLRWLRALLDAGVAVHGQIVVCPGVNDSDVLEDTLSGILDRYPELASVCVVPLGVSRYNAEEAMRPHTAAETRSVLGLVHEWQEIFLKVLGRRLVFAADEYYLLDGTEMPPAEAYEGFAMYEDGVGMARRFEQEFLGLLDSPSAHGGDFFRWVDEPGCASRPDGYRQAVEIRLSRPGPAGAPVTILTAPYGRRVLEPLIASLERDDVEVVEVEPRFFGGNVAVSGLMVGEDLARVLEQQSPHRRYLAPDSCLSAGRFLDGTSPEDLPLPVEFVAAEGHSLRQALGD